MTFSLIGRCARTGQIGCAVSTSNISVGSRVPFARAGAGAVLTQNRTDPRLGPRGLDLLASGCTAEDALAALVASTPHIGWRQLAVMDTAGRTAAYTGDRVKPHLGARHAQDCIAIGNILANDHVIPAMTEAFAVATAAPLAARLVGALEAGLAAGGEHAPVRSAALLVVATESFPVVDLRVDAADHPIAALAQLWREYQPWSDEFVLRAVDPDRAKGG
ncbi:MAG TPA: DUF1028 domain-containing protein [Candidatus Sulfotelmatobacter sp.]|nr:DUF1028 domain-containing protein [Candidatus Sulfotelmatobacter sp.]